MASATTSKWYLRGDSLVSCNCDWGCPCQFNALPTHDNCEALCTWEIREGRFGNVPLDGVRYATIYWWPGPVHEGNGVRQLIVDSKATPQQREALVALTSGKHGGGYLEIFASVCPNVQEPIVAPIEFAADHEKRTGTVSIAGVGEVHAEPIKNPVTGLEHRARINLPNGFEYKVAEMGNSTLLRAKAGKVSFEHTNCYAQFYEFEWSN